LAKCAGWAGLGLHRQIELSSLLPDEWGTFELGFVGPFGADAVVAAFIGSFSFNPERKKRLTDSL
jgi:hypothetical protein